MINPDEQHDQLRNEILQYYLRGKEAARLNIGIGPLEQARTKELITRYLPQAPQVLADIGGGPGLYACWLARSGHEVHLVDAVPLHVEQALQASEAQPEAPLASCRVGDARRLQMPDGCCDAVLLYGPLYHLLEKDDRLRALRESWRVLRQGGLLMAVAISRFASLHVGIVRWWIDNQHFQAMVENELADGKHMPPESWPTLFTTAYFHHPDELPAEVAEAGFTPQATIAVEGAGWLVPNLEERWQVPEQREALLRVVRWTEREHTVLGISPHIMNVARK